MELYFVSDTHFGHANILTFQVDGVLMRPGFSSVEEMDQCMFDRWNEIVKPQDHVYHLGDVAMMKRFIDKCKLLNGHKRLLLGNHDIYDVKDYYAAGFKKIFGSRVIANILFSHIPVHPQSLGRFDANVHGHIHANPVYRPVVTVSRDTQKLKIVPYVNVCVEATNYRPISLGEVQQQITKAQEGGGFETP